MRWVGVVWALALIWASPVVAQVIQPEGTAAQREALARLQALDGVWRGTARIQGPDGPMTLTQTERVGPMLGGSVRVIEGRGHNTDGAVRFNALAVLSWSETENRYVFRAYANGYAGDHPFEVTADGFRWETPAGPDARMSYVATVRDGRWLETGDYIVAGQPPRRVIEMDLRRLGDTDWPGGDPVPLLP